MNLHFPGKLDGFCTVHGVKQAKGGFVSRFFLDPKDPNFLDWAKFTSSRGQKAWQGHDKEGHPYKDIAFGNMIDCARHTDEELEKINKKRKDQNKLLVRPLNEYVEVNKLGKVDEYIDEWIDHYHTADGAVTHKMMEKGDVKNKATSYPKSLHGQQMAKAIYNNDPSLLTRVEEDGDLTNVIWHLGDRPKAMVRKLFAELAQLEEEQQIELLGRFENVSAE